MSINQVNATQAACTPPISPRTLCPLDEKIDAIAHETFPELNPSSQTSSLQGKVVSPFNGNEKKTSSQETTERTSLEPTQQQEDPQAIADSFNNLATDLETVIATQGVKIPVSLRPTTIQEPSHTAANTIPQNSPLETPKETTPASIPAHTSLAQPNNQPSPGLSPISQNMSTSTQATTPASTPKSTPLAQSNKLKKFFHSVLATIQSSTIFTKLFGKTAKPNTPTTTLSHQNEAQIPHLSDQISQLENESDLTQIESHAAHVLQDLQQAIPIDSPSNTITQTDLICSGLHAILSSPHTNDQQKDQAQMLLLQIGPRIIPVVINPKISSTTKNKDTLCSCLNTIIARSKGEARENALAQRLQLSGVSTQLQAKTLPELTQKLTKAFTTGSEDVKKQALNLWASLPAIQGDTVLQKSIFIYLKTANLHNNDCPPTAFATIGQELNRMLRQTHNNQEAVLIWANLSHITRMPQEIVEESITQLQRIITATAPTDQIQIQAYASIIFLTATHNIPLEKTFSNLTKDVCQKILSALEEHAPHNHQSTETQQQLFSVLKTLSQYPQFASIMSPEKPSTKFTKLSNATQYQSQLIESLPKKQLNPFLDPSLSSDSDDTFNPFTSIINGTNSTQEQGTTSIEQSSYKESSHLQTSLNQWKRPFLTK